MESLNIDEFAFLEIDTQKKKLNQIISSFERKQDWQDPQIKKYE